MLSSFFSFSLKQHFPKRYGFAIAMLLLLSLVASKLSAQQKNDSLLATFDSVQDDSARVDSMLKIVFKLGATDPMLGMWLSEQAVAQPWSHGKAWVRARAFNLRGIIYFNLKITDLAMANLLKAAEIADSFGLERVRVNSINNIGTIQENEGRFEDALKSYRSARVGYLKNGSKGNAVMALTNVALVYFDLKQYDKAIEVCDSVIDEIENPDDVNPFARVYGLLGEIYNAKKEYQRALQMLDQSIELATQGEDDNGRAEDLIIRAGVKHQLKMDASALADLTLALQMERELGILPSVVDCYNLFAKIAKDQGDTRLALEWMEKSKALADSIQTDESAAALANYQAIYDVEQKDAEIKLLNKDKEIQQANLLNVWYLFGLVSVVLLAMLVIVAVLMRSNKGRRRINLELQLKNEQILAQHEKITHQNAVLTDQNEQLHNLNHEMSGMLHVVAHDLKAPLSQVTGLLTVVEEEGNLNVTQEKMLEMAKKVTHNAGNLVKDLVELGSVEQQDAMLQKISVSLKTLISEISSAFATEAARKSIAIETTLPDDEAKCPTEPKRLRRILENLISNALKFSPTGKSVSISLTQAAGSYRISIQDQGPGISPADQKNLYRKFHKLSARPTGGESSSGLGLAIVKTLVEQLGGEISLTSEVGVGSTFVVSIPYN